MSGSNQRTNKKDGFFMNFFIDIVKGIFVGVANVIPGVSGGTMAVSFGIYDKLLSAISNLLKDFKKSFQTLLPIAIGMVIGVVGFTFIIPVILAHQPFITSAAFTGLIFGGLPMIVKSLHDGWNKDTHKSAVINIIILVVFTAFAVILPFMGGDSESGALLAVSLPTIIKVFFLGVIASATMIIPGVSGSLVLMILGYYFGIITAVKDFITALKDLDFAMMWNRALILAPFALGCIIGIFFISKLIKWLFEHFCSATYCGILGLILSSPISIFSKVQEEYGMSGTNAAQIIIGVIIFILCTVFTLYIGKLEAPKNSDA